MALPFTVDGFYGVFHGPNQAVWPVGLSCFAEPSSPRSPLFAPLLWRLAGAQAALLLCKQPDLGPMTAAVVGMGLPATAAQRPRTFKP